MKNNPYVGQRPYKREDRHNFFGRDREAQELCALIMTERAWSRIPRELHPRLLASAEQVMAELYREAMEVEDQAFEIMQDNGLVIHRLSTDELEKWRTLADLGFSMLIGETISPEIYERATTILEEYRDR